MTELVSILCKECGKSHHWKMGTCPECGEPTLNVVSELVVWNCELDERCDECKQRGGK